MLARNRDAGSRGGAIVGRNEHYCIDRAGVLVGVAGGSKVQGCRGGVGVRVRVRGEG
jgi:hypothetical protein